MNMLRVVDWMAMDIRGGIRTLIVANYGVLTKNSVMPERPHGKTAPVNRLTNISTNWYGLSDMTGNVPQWCSDLYGPYSSRDQTDPTGPSSTQENERCFRGCSWMFYEPGVFLCAYRWSTKADTKGLIGFRLTAGPE